MAIHPPRKAAEPKARGPLWQDELIGRLKSDPRFVPTLRGAKSWDAIAPMAGLAYSERHHGLAFFSSSSTGAPKRIPFSEDDWEHSVRHRADCLAALGLGERHLAAVLLPFGPWFSGDNISDALLRLGARVLPAGLYGPHLDGVLRLIAGLDANAVITTPSVAWALSSRAPLPRIDKLITVGERLSPELRHVLGTRFGAPPQALFAASETVLGYEAGAGPDEFCWDRQRLHLEILDAQGNIRESGSGELLVTRRYGEALPLLRYPLGDRVELIAGDNDGPRFRYLGRTGHGFGLVGGVKVSRSHLESFLDTLSFPIHAAEFHVFHQPEGDRLQIVLGLSSQKFLSAPDIRRLFLTSSIDIADVGASGFIEVDVVTRHAPIQAKRRITITERPWRL